MAFIKSKIDQNVLFWLYLSLEYSGVSNDCAHSIVNFWKWATKSRVIHVQISLPKQYQTMTSSVTRFSYHTKGFSNQVSSNSDGVLFQLEKVIHVQNLVRKWEENEKVGKKFLGYKTG